MIFMSNIIKPDTGGLLGLIHNPGSELVIPKPFEQEIFLLKTNIAGTSFIIGIEELYQHLKIGEHLNLFREPDNKYDKYAIVIKTINNVKLGYIPKSDNKIFARLMDAGKLIFCRISSSEIKGTWVKIDIDIFLKE